MDPALQEQLLPELDQSEKIEAIIRLREKGVYPAGIKVVAEFNDIITCRVVRQDIRTVYNDPAVKSFKAAKLLQNDSDYIEAEEKRMNSSWGKSDFFSESESDMADATGKNVFIAVLDWGGDFAHQDFINTDGTSRFHAIWDQGYEYNKQSPTPYGYGKLYSKKMIDAALKTSRPYQSLGYHPGRTDRKAEGMHGTHVLGIAASNGASGTKGVAPEANIIFVHLATESNDQFSNLGDSVRLLEAIDFAHKVAGDSPLVINLSVGRHGGSHDGKSLVELGMDRFLLSNDNRAICQSTGNYYSNQSHTAGIIYPGKTKSFSFSVPANDKTNNELEVWYEGEDEFGIILTHNASGTTVSCSIDDKSEIKINNKVVGRIYHRSKEPNNGKNQIDILLYRQAPSGLWTVKLTGIKITDGRFHCWIERDNPGMQSRFVAANIVPTGSTGTICNGLYTIAVGAVDSTVSPYQIAWFSSSGPTVDGRYKPNLLAPGINIISSKSSPPTQTTGGKATVSMMGTSMASPYVAGAVALLMQRLSQPVSIHSIRRILLSSADATIVSHIDDTRKGSGFVDTVALLEAATLFNNNQLVFENFSAVQDSLGEDSNLEMISNASENLVSQDFINDCAV